MVFKMGVGGFEDALVLVVEINDSLEDVISHVVVFLYLSAVEDNLINQNFSQVLKQLQLLLLANNRRGLIKLLEPGLNPIINNLFHKLFQKPFQFSITQPINILKPFLNKLPHHSGLIHNILQSLSLILFHQFILMLIINLFS